MSSISNTIKDKTTETEEKTHFKTGKSIKGGSGIIFSKNGKEEKGEVVYKRKAEYKYHA